ncbi:hypothetical protein D3874_17720 [Oleomonas cavernae]|uniref:Uncharacterized protein n=1 Tax=Oleomonas cavernae TaxID=2320859 RepID=A0A418WF10_9PROT|nr:hypothetical protein [Oleomonas cavernae]RJF88608.1 hypothetical protein D3874_17720 [Oleomonas cavernae]
MSGDAEIEFINEIDCCFPYNDEARWTELIARGVRISPNAAFMVLHEICRPPNLARVTPTKLRQILAHWRGSFDHPLLEMMVGVAEAMIEGRELPVQEVIDWMHRVAEYRDLYTALGILNCASEDADGLVQTTYENIVRQWRSPHGEPIGV